MSHLHSPWDMAYFTSLHYCMVNPLNHTTVCLWTGAFSLSMFWHPSQTGKSNTLKSSSPDWTHVIWSDIITACPCSLLAILDSIWYKRLTKLQQTKFYTIKQTTIFHIHQNFTDMNSMHAPSINNLQNSKNLREFPIFVPPNLQDNSEEISWLNKTERTQEPFKTQHSYLVNVPACKHAANICSAVIWVSCRLLETSCSIQSNSEGTSVTAAATDLPTSLVVNFGNELCNKAQHLTVIWHCANQYCTTANWHD